MTTIANQFTAGSMTFAPVAGTMIHSSQDQLDQAVNDLQASKAAWVGLPAAQRITLLGEIIRDLLAVGPEWVRVSAEAKGAVSGGEVDHFITGEEWIIYSSTIRMARLLRETLYNRRKDGNPHRNGQVKTMHGGQAAVRVFPLSWQEKLLFTGMRSETWLTPGTDAESYHQPSHKDGRVALVLGAGNVSSAPATDVLQKLFVEDEVVILKMNPVNDYLGPLMEKGFSSLIRQKFLHIVYGGAEEGAYLCEHPAVDTIHLTGSDKTFDRIVFGPGQPGGDPAKRSPRLHKSITAELGGVNPVIIVPGPWKAKDIRRAALMLASWVYSNAAFSCMAPRLIIQQRDWPQRQELLDAFTGFLSEMPLRKAFYPGAADRNYRFLTAHPEARQFGQSRAGCLPWSLIPDIDPDNPADPCFRTESFCGVIAEIGLEGPAPAEFIAHAVDFSNRYLWGNLAATLIAPHQVEHEPSVGQAIQQAAANLRYGTVSINIYAGFVYTMLSTPWGAYPGAKLEDIQSGVGFVNNPHMLPNPQKSVIYAPFHRIDPASIKNRNLEDFGRRYAAFQENLSPLQLPGLILAAL